MSDELIDYDPIHYRLRCQGYILNLCAQAFLWKTQEDALADENNVFLDTRIPIEVEMQEWRKKGPLGKAYNILRDINISL